MIKKTASSTAEKETKEEVLEKMQIVEIPKVSVGESNSFITVQIRNCVINVTDETNLKLLKKISEAFNYD